MSGDAFVALDEHLERHPLDALAAFVSRFVALSADQLVAVVLWIAHTHAIDAFDTTPYLAVTSAAKRAGKSRLLEVCELLVQRPLPAANVTPAALFRSLGSENPPTLLMDEVDAIYGPKANGDEDLRALLNAGYRRGIPVLRCVGDGSRQTVVEFAVFGAKVLAGIGRLPDTIADRCLPIRMKRRSRGEPIQRLRRREVGAEADSLRALCAAWALDNLDMLAAARPDLPTQLDDRAQDAYEPLLAIADIAGGAWPRRARIALLNLRAGNEDETTPSERILWDCRTVFEARDIDRVATTELLEDLKADAEAPWRDWARGSGLSARGLARLLGEYGIKSRTIRLPGGDTAKGYLRASFEDAWNHWAPHSRDENVTASQPSKHAGSARGGKNFAESDSSRLKPFTDAGCDGVSDRSAERGQNDGPRLGEDGFAALLQERFDNGQLTRREVAHRVRLHERVRVPAPPSPADEDALWTEANEEAGF